MSLSVFGGAGDSKSYSTTYQQQRQSQIAAQSEGVVASDSSRIEVNKLDQGAIQAAFDYAADGAEKVYEVISDALAFVNVGNEQSLDFAKDTQAETLKQVAHVSETAASEIARAYNTAQQKAEPINVNQALMVAAGLVGLFLTYKILKKK